MSMSDPIGDMVTRIRNAHGAGHAEVIVPHSRLKGDIARVLKSEGYITDYAVEGESRKGLRIYLKYSRGQEPAIRKIRRVSRPGLRKYAGSDDMPRVLGGMGTVIVTTPSGIMTGKEARKRRVGGEVLCEVW